MLLENPANNFQIYFKNSLENILLLTALFKKNIKNKLLLLLFKDFLERYHLKLIIKLKKNL